MVEASRVQKLLLDQNAEINRLRSRIEKLEAALREIAYTEPEDKYWPGRIARKALEGKDE